MVTAVIVAAGTGSRMGDQTLPKQFLPVKGIAILEHTLRKFEASTSIDHIILVIRHEDRARCEQLVASSGLKKIHALTEGGKERQDSVFAGLQHAPPTTDVVLIHDAVRMFVTERMITETICEARHYGASIVAVPTKDTIKQVGGWPADQPLLPGSTPTSDDLFVMSTLERASLWQIQTPQAFQYQLICTFYEQARSLGLFGTDDAMLAEYFGHPVKIVQGSYRNIKITTPDDLLIAEAFLQESPGETP